MNKLSGIMWGVASGASFGLIPLFTLPLIAAGITTDSILFYRFAAAATIMGLLQLIRKENFRINKRQLTSLGILSLFYMASSMFLLWGYQYMAAGIATAVHFLYPVCVMIIMAIVFGERISATSIGAVVLAIVGVSLLSACDSNGGSISTLGMVIVVISALAYALYIVALRKINIGSMSSSMLTFYVLLFTALIFLAKAFIHQGSLSPIGSTNELLNILGLGLVPTVVSNFALIRAVKIIGSTTTSILGAMEPLTAVAIGVTVFDEPLSMAIFAGVAMIVGAVAAVVAVPSGNNSGHNRNNLH